MITSIQLDGYTLDQLKLAQANHLRTPLPDLTGKSPDEVLESIHIFNRAAEIEAQRVVPYQFNVPFAWEVEEFGIPVPPFSRNIAAVGTMAINGCSANLNMSLPDFLQFTLEQFKSSGVECQIPYNYLSIAASLNGSRNNYFIPWWGGISVDQDRKLVKIEDLEWFMRYQVTQSYIPDSLRNHFFQSFAWVESISGSRSVGRSHLEFYRLTNLESRDTYHRFSVRNGFSITEISLALLSPSTGNRQVKLELVTGDSLPQCIESVCMRVANPSELWQIVKSIMTAKNLDSFIVNANGTYQTIKEKLEKISK